MFLFQGKRETSNCDANIVLGWHKRLPFICFPSAHDSNQHIIPHPNKCLWNRGKGTSGVSCTSGSSLPYSVFT